MLLALINGSRVKKEFQTFRISVSWTTWRALGTEPKSFLTKTKEDLSLTQAHQYRRFDFFSKISVQTWHLQSCNYLKAKHTAD